MIRLSLTLALLLATFTCLAKAPPVNNTDLYYSEGLYHAYQAQYFEAISRLDSELSQYYGLDEPELNSLYYYIDNAEFSVGDFELYYRMHKRAGRAMKSVIEGDVNEQVRNDAIYRLSKLFHNKNQTVEALYAVQGIEGEVPKKIQNDLELLKGQIFIAAGRFSDAVDVLKKVEKSATGLAGYNLAIALVGSGQKQKGIEQLDRVGQIRSTDEMVLAIRDKSNLVLGFELMKTEQPELAKTYFERIRLDGPFSNRALFGSGWADTESGRYERALVPWTLLAKRNITDQSVQEVLLGLPYTYTKLEAHGTAAILYGQALEAFSQELDKLDASIASILEGNFLKAVVREEFRQDENWLINLRKLPDTPETYYLTELLASNDFYESVKNYFDLVELEKKISSWDGHLDAYTEIIAYRKKYYTPLLPAMQEEFRQLDSRMKLRLAQRERIVERLDKMLVSPRPDFLATVNERIALNNIYAIENNYAATKRQMDSKTAARIRRLKGVIDWDLRTEYHQRFTEAQTNVNLLNEFIDALNEQYRSFVRARQAATQSYVGYEDPIRKLKNRIKAADERIKLLQVRQGNLLEAMAIDQLKTRRERIEELQIKARFAMAESYDRAVKAQQQQVVQDATDNEAPENEASENEASENEASENEASENEASENEGAEQ